MPVYKLYYFDAKALGESIRMLFAYGEQPFEDIRIARINWPAFKEKTLFGQIPVLEIDGKQFAQSISISRYLGRKFGLAGSTGEENLEIDQVVDFIMDLRTKASQFYYEQDEALKAKFHEEFTKNVYPNMLNKLNDIIEENKGHMALKKLTWADFVFAGILDYIKELVQQPDLEKKYPNFQKVVDNVISIPKVKAYITKNPHLEYNF